MTLLLLHNIPYLGSVRIFSCSYNDVDTTPPTPLHVLKRVKIYGNKYKYHNGKRKRWDNQLKHIPTKYWHSNKSFSQSFHAMQCMDTKNGKTAKLLTSFEIYKNPGNSWEWHIRGFFDKINIYCFDRF